MSHARLLVWISIITPLPSQGVIADANVTFDTGTIRADATESWNGRFSANPALADVLHEWGWYYRVHSDRDIDADEVAFRGVNMTSSFRDDRGQLRWRNVDDRSLFDAELDLVVASAGPRSGTVTARMTVRNRSDRPLTIDLLHYVDLALCSVGGDEVSGVADRHRVRGTCPDGDTVEFHGAAVDHSSIRQAADDECGIRDGAPTLLTDGTPPFGPGDYSAAMQWSAIALRPGESASVVTTLAHNTTAHPWASRRYGSEVPGIHGIPEIALDVPARVGGRAFIGCSRCTPRSTAFLLMGLEPIDLSVPGIAPLSILVHPAIVVVANTPSADFSFPIDVPDDVRLAGASTFFQYLNLDPASPNGVMSQTRGLRVVIGAASER